MKTFEEFQHRSINEDASSVLTAVEDVLNGFKGTAAASSNICKALVGNECDRPDRVIKEEDGKKLADEYNMAFYETSAKSGQNVNEVFTYLTTEILKISKTKDKDTNIVIHKKKRDKKHTGCCKNKLI